jgi:hypothetical protein
MAHPQVDSSLHAANPEAKRQGMNMYNTSWNPTMSMPRQFVGTAADRQTFENRKKNYANAQDKRDMAAAAKQGKK